MIIEASWKLEKPRHDLPDMPVLACWHTAKQIRQRQNKCGGVLPRFLWCDNPGVCDFYYSLSNPMKPLYVWLPLNCSIVYTNSAWRFFVPLTSDKSRRSKKNTVITMQRAWPREGSTSAPQAQSVLASIKSASVMIPIPRCVKQRMELIDGLSETSIKSDHIVQCSWPIGHIAQCSGSLTHFTPQVSVLPSKKNELCKFQEAKFFDDIYVSWCCRQFLSITWPPISPSCCNFLFKYSAGFHRLW